jgi:hypothetical protein
MYKKVFIPSLLIILGTTVYFLSASEKGSKNRSSQIPSFSSLKSEPITSVKESDSPPSPLTRLEIEIAHIEKELASINVDAEVNNPATPQDRREWIIGRMNLYAKKMGQLAKMQVQQIDEEMKKEIQ